MITAILIASAVAVLATGAAILYTYRKPKPIEVPYTFFSGINGADDFWKIYVANTHPAYKGYRWTDNNAWLEWDSIKLAPTIYCDKPMEYMKNARVDEDGFLWSWGTSREWPDGRDHYDQLPRYINAMYNYYCWTRNETWLREVWPKAVSIMKFVRGRSDPLFATPSAPDNYMDQIKCNKYDAWINAAVYTAIQNMIELCPLMGEDPEPFRRWEASFPVAFDSIFWTGTRYAGWNDGTRHDCGYAFISLEALVRGLGNQDKANRILNWLDNNLDIYHYVFAPRTNSIPIPDWDWDPWSDPPEGRAKYGTIMQNGGSFMWFTYYDVMARLKYQDANRAYERLQGLLRRFLGDSQRMTLNESRLYTDRGESITEIGTSQGPENGIAIMSLLYGFMGVKVDTTDGIKQRPKLPSGVPVLRARVMYSGREVVIVAS